METFEQSHLNKTLQDKFRIVITTPKVLRGINSHSSRTNETVDVDTLQISNIGINVPPSVIKSTQLPFRGQTPQLTSWGRDAIPNIKINFKIDNRFNNYFYLWKWHSMINDPRSALPSTLLTDPAINVKENSKVGDLKIDYKKVVTSKDYSDYLTTITVFGKDEYNVDVIRFDYINCLPVSVGDFSYNFQQTNQIESNFEFVCSQFEVTLIEI